MPADVILGFHQAGQADVIEMYIALRRNDVWNCEGKTYSQKARIFICAKLKL